jgi:hypothetical protein
MRGWIREDPAFGMSLEKKFSCAIKLICPVQSSPKKDSRFLPPQITSISTAIPSRFEGRIAIVTDVGTGCGGRKLRCRRRRFLRTVKSCGPDTPTLVSSWWKQFHQ